MAEKKKKKKRAPTLMPGDGRQRERDRAVPLSDILSVLAGNEIGQPSFRTLNWSGSRSRAPGPERPAHAAGF